MQKGRRRQNGDHNSEKDYVHDALINRDSMLYKILQEEKIQVNSRHNKHIPSTDLDISAYSEDGLIEGIEDKNKKFFIGVQWHPETLTEDKYSKKLFDYFINIL